MLPEGFRAFPMIGVTVKQDADWERCRLESRRLHSPLVVGETWYYGEEAAEIRRQRKAKAMMVVMQNDYPLEIVDTDDEEVARKHCKVREWELNGGARIGARTGQEIYVRAYKVPIVEAKS